MKTSTSTYLPQSPYSWAWWQATSQQTAATVQTWLETQVEHVLRALTGTQTPHVWMVRDRQGQFWWNGYDPITRRHISHCSEDDLRVWLEARYNA